LAFADIIEDEPRGARLHTQAETKRLLELMAPFPKIETAKRAGKRMVAGLYRRIRADAAGAKAQRAEVCFDDIVGCLRIPAGGSSRQTIVIVDRDVVKSRLLSPREAARLLGLPEDYQLPANLNEALAIAGDGRRRENQS
jgi:DNA (cytosine-5)-methyltransferase 1